jgi:hypothetical protein
MKDLVDEDGNFIPEAAAKPSNDFTETFPTAL